MMEFYLQIINKYKGIKGFVSFHNRVLATPPIKILNRKPRIFHDVMGLYTLLLFSLICGIFDLEGLSRGLTQSVP
jgi:hypothetical protein